ncbi:ATP-dependent DNA helicase Q1-like [Montipora capricornis]|uniref:ATP-dependent DNA helicase Q1-like n=1 Tax=Montipora capricornis TaxID=246305 RepID=UPI0035F11A78
MQAPEIVDISINNKNIRFSVQKIKKGLQCFNWLVAKIATQQQSTSKTIIFCRSITDISTVLSYLLTKLGSAAYVDQEKSPLKCLIAVYHSNSPKESKVRVNKSLKLNDGPIRIVLATSALSLGVNFKDVRTHLQEAGRAGRDGRAAFNVLYYHGHHLRLCDKDFEESLKVTSCYRVAFLKTFDSIVKPLNEGHNCCSNCHQACQCSGENCAVSLPVFESVDSQETMTQGERIINGTDIADFESALKELQDNLDGNVTFSILGNKLMTHGFSDVIKEIVYDVQHILLQNILLKTITLYHYL